VAGYHDDAELVERHCQPLIVPTLPKPLSAPNRLNLCRAITSLLKSQNRQSRRESNAGFRAFAEACGHVVADGHSFVGHLPIDERPHGDECVQTCPMLQPRIVAITHYCWTSSLSPITSYQASLRCPSPYCAQAAPGAAKLFTYQRRTFGVGRLVALAGCKRETVGIDS
jgi:hypothetical protein